jgi:hypothetical protein
MMVNILSVLALVQNDFLNTAATNDEVVGRNLLAYVW